MTKVGGTGPGREDASDPESKWWWRIGHAAPWLVATLWLATTASTLIGWPLVGVAAMATALVLMTAGTKHDGQAVCIRCLREQPDNGGELAVRKQPHLWSFHLVNEGPLPRVAILATLILSALWSDSPVGTVLAVIVGTVIAYDWFTTYTHRTLKPWCPWCRDPGDDDLLVEPSPDPSMTKRA